jgi:hypothetical protein
MTDSEMIASAIFGTKHIILYVVVIVVIIGAVAMTMRGRRT